MSALSDDVPAQRSVADSDLIAGVRFWDLVYGVVVAGTLALLFTYRHEQWFFLENAPAEGSQEVYLFISALLFLFTAMRNAERQWRLELYGLALLTFSMTVRENDVRNTWAEPYLGYVQQHHWQNIVQVPFWIVLIALGLMRISRVVPSMLRWLQTYAGIAMVLGIVCYLAAYPFDKSWFHYDHSFEDVIEETLESCGTLFILGSAYLTFRRRGGFGSGRSLRP